MPDEPPAGRIEELRFVPLAATAATLARELVPRASRALSLPCRLMPADEGLPVAPLPGRTQIDADRLLAAVEARADDARTALVALTPLDIGSPIFTHHFGRSRLGGRAALVSFARLAPSFYGLPDDADLLLRRATAEVVHEVGHLFGLPHCDDPSCVMRFAHVVEAIDVRGAGYCARCRARTER